MMGRWPERWPEQMARRTYSECAVSADVRFMMCGLISQHAPRAPTPHHGHPPTHQESRAAQPLPAGRGSYRDGGEEGGVVDPCAEPLLCCALCSVLCALCAVRCAVLNAPGCVVLGWAGLGAQSELELIHSAEHCAAVEKHCAESWVSGALHRTHRTGQDRTGHAGRQASRQAGLWRCGALRSVCLHGMPAYACRCFDRTPTPCPAPGQRPYSPPAVRSSAPRMPSHGPERLGRGTLWLAGSWAGWLAGWLACVRRMLPACRVLVQQPPPLRVRHSVSE